MTIMCVYVGGRVLGLWRLQVFLLQCTFPYSHSLTHPLATGFPIYSLEDLTPAVYVPLPTLDEEKQNRTKMNPRGWEECPHPSWDETPSKSFPLESGSYGEDPGCTMHNYSSLPPARAMRDFSWVFTVTTQFLQVESMKVCGPPEACSPRNFSPLGSHSDFSSSSE